MIGCVAKTVAGPPTSATASAQVHERPQHRTVCTVADIDLSQVEMDLARSEACPAELQAPLARSYHEIAQVIAKRTDITPDAAEVCACCPEVLVRNALWANPACPDGIVNRAAHGSFPELRFAELAPLAKRCTEPEALRRLLELSLTDPDRVAAHEQVVGAALLNLALPDADALELLRPLLENPHLVSLHSLGSGALHLRPGLWLAAEQAARGDWVHRLATVVARRLADGLEDPTHLALWARLVEHLVAAVEGVAGASDRANRILPPELAAALRDIVWTEALPKDAKERIAVTLRRLNLEESRYGSELRRLFPLPISELERAQLVEIACTSSDAALLDSLVADDDRRPLVAKELLANPATSSASARAIVRHEFRFAAEHAFALRPFDKELVVAVCVEMPGVVERLPNAIEIAAAVLEQVDWDRRDALDRYESLVELLDEEHLARLPWPVAVRYVAKLPNVAARVAETLSPYLNESLRSLAAVVGEEFEGPLAELGDLLEILSAPHRPRASAPS